MSTIIDGKQIAAKIHQEISRRAAALRTQGCVPRLEVVLVGNAKASQTYVRLKGEAAKNDGLDFRRHELPVTTTAADLIARLNEIQADPLLSGLIVQLPLPEHLYIPEVLNAINPEVDVDCLTDKNLGRLVMNTVWLIPPTPGAIFSIMEDLGQPIAGKNVTVIGMGALVGKPLAIMLANAKASVTSINSQTKNVKEKLLGADIIVSGVGKKDLVRGDMVSPGTIVIDTGISFENGKVHGDVNFEEVSAKAKYLTPTPGGVGPITVALLLRNTVLCAERKFGDKKIRARG